MERHCHNAMRIAEWLEGHDKVERVIYPGLASHPQHDLARRQMPGFGGIVTFFVDGAFEGEVFRLQREAGIRLSVGIEDCEDLIADLAAALG